MNARTAFSIGVVMLAMTTVPAHGQRGGHGSHGHGQPGGGAPAWGHGRPLVYVPAFGIGGFYGAYPPFMMMSPVGFFPPMDPMAGGLFAGGGPLLAAPPPGLWPAQPGVVRRASARRSDVARSTLLTTVGDRLFRAGNLKKAEERYEQALRAAPDQAGPRVRLAQVAFVRGAYADAATRLREAETVQPGWLVTAGDIQPIFGEPTEFARHMGRLQSYVQAHPQDRDAWLVLGAEFFLTGRTAKAADVFKRLNDPSRKPDVALSAFLDASNQGAAEPAKPPNVPANPFFR